MSGSILCDFQRWVSAPPARVRADLANVLRRLKFKVAADQTSVIEATRGSQMASSAMVMSKLPLAVTIQVRSGDGSGTGLSVRIEDRWRSPFGKIWGANTPYRTLFDEVAAKLDEALARLDPHSAASFEPPRFWSATGDVAALERTNVAAGNVGDKAVQKATRVLEGGPKKTDQPAAWKGVVALRFDAPAGSLQLDAAEVRTRLTVAALIGSQPDGMPETLVRRIEALATKVEQALSGGRGVVVIQLDAGEQKVVEFLHMQARIRAELPMRILTTCQECRFQKVSNPDLERVRRRNDRLRTLTSSLGASFGRGGPSPFVVFGTWFRMTQLDPDFVCPRCQGMLGAGRIVTFCPECGDRRDEAVLTKCPKCQYDFRRSLRQDELWRELPAPNQPLAAFPPPPPTASAPPAPMGTAPPPQPMHSTPPPPAHTPSGGLASPVPAPVPPPPVPRTSPPPPPPPPTPHSAQPPPPPPPAAAARQPPPPPPPPTARRCDWCGRATPVLWRVVVWENGTRAVHTLCGQPPRCAPPSLEPPVRV